jgi:hypothetical protein
MQLSKPKFFGKSWHQIPDNNKLSQEKSRQIVKRHVNVTCIKRIGVYGEGTAERSVGKILY